MHWFTPTNPGLRGIAGVLTMTLGGCLTPPQYDDQTDKLISQLQTDVDTEIVTLISLDHKIANLKDKTDAASQKDLAEAKPKAEFDANSTFYDRVDVDLIALRMRVDAEPNIATPRLDSAINYLRKNLLEDGNCMRTLHQQNDVILSEFVLTNMQKLVDAQIGALLTAELELKNSSTSSSSTGSAAK